ncbi:MAG: hypothetical protein RR636_05955 [Clostridium sp.]|uniref:hypothetical protein n=1 Tax=Clostridium sp. TaxID=1506 RepID=UPI003052C8E5
MKNIINIIMYSFRSLRLTYIIEAIILIICISSNFFIYKFTLGLDLISTVSIALIINFVSHVIIFSRQLSKESGRLLFLTPIKGIEFILGNFLELLLVNFFVVASTYILVIINSNVFTSIWVWVYSSVFIELMIGYLIITALIAIFSCYIRRTVLCIFAVICSCALINIIYDFLSKVLLYLLPYLYVSIGRLGFIEIDIFSVILDTIALIALQFVAAYMIDKKLDII